MDFSSPLRLQPASCPLSTASGWEPGICVEYASLISSSNGFAPYLISLFLSRDRDHRGSSMATRDERTRSRSHDRGRTVGRAGRILAAGLMRLQARKSSPLSADLRRKFARLYRPPERSCRPPDLGESGMTDTVLARLAALKTTPIAGAEAAMARPLRDRAAALQPPLPRKPARLPHPGTGLWRPEARDDRSAWRRSARHLDGGDPARRRRAGNDRPIAGTRLIREWQGVEHCVTVRDDDFEYQGRPTNRSRPLPAPSPARAGTAWCSSASRTRRGPAMKKPDRPQAPLRGLHPQVHRGRPGQEFNSPRRPARGLRGLHRQPEGRGLGAGARPLRRRRLLRRHAGAPRAASACWPTSRPAGSTSWWSTRSTGSAAR